MTDGGAQPVVLDATVLSNFASSGAVDQLVTLLKSTHRPGSPGRTRAGKPNLRVSRQRAVPSRRGHPSQGHRGAREGGDSPHSHTPRRGRGCSPLESTRGKRDTGHGRPRRASTCIELRGSRYRLCRTTRVRNSPWDVLDPDRKPVARLVAREPRRLRTRRQHRGGSRVRDRAQLVARRQTKGLRDTVVHRSLPGQVAVLTIFTTSPSESSWSSAMRRPSRASTAWR